MKALCKDNSCLETKPLNQIQVGEIYEVAETFKVRHMGKDYEFYVIEWIGNFLTWRFQVVL